MMVSSEEETRDTYRTEDGHLEKETNGSPVVTSHGTPRAT